MDSMCFGSSSCNARVRLKDASAFTGNPSSSLISFQCRSRRPGFRSATIKGKFSPNPVTLSLSSSQTSIGTPLSDFIILTMARLHRSTSFVVFSGSSEVNGPFIHCGNERLNSAATRHMLP